MINYNVICDVLLKGETTENIRILDNVDTYKWVMQYSVGGKCSSCTYLSNQGVQSKVASFKKPVMMLIINLDANTIITAV